MLGLALDQSSSVVWTCHMHERHYEDESKLFGCFFNAAGDIMCRRYGNTRGYRSGAISKDMAKVVTAYVEKNDERDFHALV